MLVAIPPLPHDVVLTQAQTQVYLYLHSEGKRPFINPSYIGLINGLYYQVYTDTKHWIKLHIISVINIEYYVTAFIKILQVIVEQNIFLNKRHYDKNLVVNACTWVCMKG